VLRPFRSIIPTVDPSAFVDQSAQVIGDVHIGAESSVWMNVVIRGDVHYIRIGARTNVQDGTIVHVMRDTHPTVIGNDVTIGHGAIVHGCTIEDRCLIGMGAILLNGCRIGTGSIIAAGSLVVEGAVIPPGSMVRGTPARVWRQLTAEEDSSLQWYADNYVRYRLDFQSASAAAPLRRDPHATPAAQSRQSFRSLAAFRAKMPVLDPPASQAILDDRESKQ
jgi:carbonic anhydrase/acetyltransferase-like protein (isoleucine patch superfamily)